MYHDGRYNSLGRTNKPIRLRVRKMLKAKRICYKMRQNEIDRNMSRCKSLPVTTERIRAYQKKKQF
jgi:hypothetical protein